VQKLNFLPKSYTNRYSKIILRAYFVIIIFLLIGNIGMIYINFWKYIDYKSIKGKYAAEQIKTSSSESPDNHKEAENNSMLLVEVYYDLELRYSEQNFKEIEISKDNIKIVSSHVELQQYIDFLKEIEQDKKLKIVDLQPPVIRESDIESRIVVNYIK
jgi:hypothetical protein